MAINLLNEVKGAPAYPSERFNSRERKQIKETSGPAKMATALYDFSVSGGEVGTIDLGLTIPADAIITRLWTDAITSMTSGGSATVAIEVGAVVLKAATAFNDATYVGVDAQTLTAVKTTVSANLEVVIAAAALTAGKVRIFVEYLQSEV